MRTLHLLAALPLALSLHGCKPDEPLDEDGDGYQSSVDCDDGDAAVHPGASELKGDQIDNDCDELTDCEDDELAGLVEGDVGAGDVPTLCEAWCSLTVVGDVALQGTALTDLDGLACVTEVQGDVRIEENAALTSLAGLGALREVTGALVIGDGGCEGDLFMRPTCSGTGNPALTSLAGLESLEHVGTFLTIAGNDALVDPATGFPALTRVGGADENVNWGVLILHNPALTALPAFPVLDNAGEYFSVLDNASLASLDGMEVLGQGSEPYLFVSVGLNPALTDLTGLSGLGAFEGGLSVVWNDGLSSLAGIENLSSVAYSLEIWGNSALTSLDGLGAITTVGEFLQMNDNDALTSLDGLGALESVGFDFNVFDNDALASLNGVEAMRTIGGNLQIGALVEATGNDVLSDLDGLHGLSSVGGDVIIRCEPALSRVEVDELIGAIDTIGGAVNLDCE